MHAKSISDQLEKSECFLIHTNLFYRPNQGLFQEERSIATYFKLLLTYTDTLRTFHSPRFEIFERISHFLPVSYSLYLFRQHFKLQQNLSERSVSVTVLSETVLCHSLYFQHVALPGRDVPLHAKYNSQPQLHDVWCLHFQKLPYYSLYSSSSYFISYFQITSSFVVLNCRRFVDEYRLLGWGCTFLKKEVIK